MGQRLRFVVPIPAVEQAGIRFDVRIRYPNGRQARVVGNIRWSEFRKGSTLLQRWAPLMEQMVTADEVIREEYPLH